MYNGSCFMQDDNYIHPEAYKALDRQRAANKERKDIHAREIEGVKNEMRRETELGLFDISRTEKQMRGMPIKGFVPSNFKMRKKKTEYWSKCCKAAAYCYRSIHYGGGKPAEEWFRCRECYEDCEVQKTKPRAGRNSGS